MATRNPASVALPNFKGCDWYEPYRAWTAQKKVYCPTALTSDVIYGHNGTTPVQVEYPA
jgi:hypothetical protein